MATFVDFWMAYPKRKGSNPRALAELKYNLAIKKGASPDHLISSVRKYADELREQDLVDTPYVCMAATWLNQRRWLDYAPDDGERALKMDADMAQRGYRWDGERWVKKTDSQNDPRYAQNGGPP